MSQTKLILEYLRQGNSLTPLEALNRFQTMRLASRILDLKREGHLIQTEIINKGSKSFASYKLTGQTSLL